MLIRCARLGNNGILWSIFWSHWVVVATKQKLKVVDTSNVTAADWVAINHAYEGSGIEAFCNESQQIDEFLQTTVAAAFLPDLICGLLEVRMAEHGLTLEDLREVLRRSPVVPRTCSASPDDDRKAVMAALVKKIGKPPHNAKNTIANENSFSFRLLEVERQRELDMPTNRKPAGALIG